MDSLFIGTLILFKIIVPFVPIYNGFKFESLQNGKQTIDENQFGIENRQKKTEKNFVFEQNRTIFHKI